MKKVFVNVGRGYDILINEPLQNLGSRARDVLGAKKVLVCTDTNVEKLYLKKAVQSLEKSGFEVFSFVIQSGEEFKTPKTYLEIINACEEAKLTRKDALVALGGGVVGDIVGFAASTYMRGIDVVQIPTTLLSAIDSSVGGKTGVDLPSGKNLLGAFYQPRLVLFDQDLLKTMKVVDWKNGIAEGIKYAVIAGGEILQILENELDLENLERFVELAVTIKKDIVEFDEKESGLRKYLNLGHSFGHAIETLSDYKTPHGLAVAKGLFFIAKFAEQNGYSDNAFVEKLGNLLEKYDFDVHIPYAYPHMIKSMKMDKKASDTTISLIIPKQFGKTDIIDFPFEKLKEIGKVSL